MNNRYKSFFSRNKFKSKLLPSIKRTFQKINSAFKHNDKLTSFEEISTSYSIRNVTFVECFILSFISSINKTKAIIHQSILISSSFYAKINELCQRLRTAYANS